MVLNVSCASEAWGALKTILIPAPDTLVSLVWGSVSLGTFKNSTGDFNVQPSLSSCSGWFKTPTPTTLGVIYNSLYKTPHVQSDASFLVMNVIF